MFGVVVTSTAQQRAGWLVETAQVIDEYFPKASGGRPGTD
jgi:hypothetical protein